jgi:hypothetical protein
MYGEVRNACRNVDRKPKCACKEYRNMWEVINPFVLNIIYIYIYIYICNAELPFEFQSSTDHCRI